MQNEDGQSVERAKEILSLNLGWIAAADSKVGTFLAIATAMLAGLAASVPKPSAWTFWVEVTAALGAVLLLATLVFLLLAAFPRTTGPQGSMIFFGGIGKMTAEEYVDKLRSLSDGDFFVDLATQCHRNAEIAKQKHQLVRLATRFLFLAVTPWLVTIYLIYVQKT